jgi:hypothetical protein
MTSVFERHGDEIKLYEMGAGKKVGQLLFASAILSDVIEMHPETREEVDEVKELIGSVVMMLMKKKKEVL